jgi:hypothetical protein
MNAGELKEPRLSMFKELLAGIPVLRFVHKDIKLLTGDKLEETDEGKRKLKAFTEEAKKKMCKFWTNPEGLAAQVVLSLTSMIKTNPRTGWIKGDVMTSEKSKSEIIRLKDENEELRAKIKKMEENAPSGIENLSQGDDLYSVHFDYKVYEENDTYETEYEDGSDEFSWNQIFAFLSPHLVILNVRSIILILYLMILFDVMQFLPLEESQRYMMNVSKRLRFNL